MLTYLTDRAMSDALDGFEVKPRASVAEDGSMPDYELIELLFFAYRDFVSDPDRILLELGFGRAHHRVLHFVSRRPGLPVADLLELLRITKQSLNRVLKELIDKGFVEGRVGTQDRRQRLLFPTEAGSALAIRLSRVQTRRIAHALEEASKSERVAVSDFLRRMIDIPGSSDPSVPEDGGSS